MAENKCGSSYYDEGDKRRYFCILPEGHTDGHDAGGAWHRRWGSNGQREFFQADKTPNPTYHHLVGYQVGEAMVGIDTTTSYIQLVWLNRAPHGDRRQTMSRDHLTSLGFFDVNNVIVEEELP